MTKPNLKKFIASVIFITALTIIFVVPLVSAFAQAGNTTNGQGSGNTTNGQGSGNTTNGQGSGNQSADLRFTITNPFNVGGTLYDVLNAILDKAIIPIGSIVVVIMIIYSGFLFVTARGDETQISNARRSLLYSAIGAAILLGAVGISKGIQATIDALK